MEEKKARPHTVIIDNRKTLTASGVSNVDSFDEKTIVAYTDCGELIISGSGLKIDKLSVETGEMIIKGEIGAMAYSENKASGSVFSKIFR